MDAVIQLPDNLFFGTMIATCIIVLKKSKKDNSILFIDATPEFVHEGNKNKLSPDNISRILNAYIARKDEEHFTRLVSRDAIEANDYNISVSSYVEQADTRETIDIHALNKKIAEIVKREDELRKAIDAIVADLEGAMA